jgi:hypothetical protein
VTDDGARERYDLSDDDATPEIVLDEGEPAEAIATVTLLDGDGRTWCTATFT